MATIDRMFARFSGAFTSLCWSALVRLLWAATFHKHGIIVRMLGIVGFCLILMPVGLAAWERIHPRPQRRRSREREAAEQAEEYARPLVWAAKSGSRSQTPPEGFRGQRDCGAAPAVAEHGGAAGDGDSGQPGVGRGIGVVLFQTERGDPGRRVLGRRAALSVSGPGDLTHGHFRFRRRPIGS
ncbi:hypothetical protein [Streptacidiphilus cavernicola]|uniref:Uncharacterized protein n=1 Tax=Streptacidiphilus cavernicola TaxID=3342716 RepID=A0ABV6VRF5_9ACTN